MGFLKSISELTVLFSGLAAIAISFPVAVFLRFVGIGFDFFGLWLGAIPKCCPDCQGNLTLTGYGDFGGHKLRCLNCNRWEIDGVSEEEWEQVSEGNQV